MDETKRKAFLERLSRALGRDGVPETIEPYDHSRGPQHALYRDASQEDIVEKFKIECDKVGTKFIETAERDLPAVLLEEIKFRGNGKVIYPKCDEISRYGLDAAFAAASGDEVEFVLWDADKGREANIDAAQDASVGVTFPVLGIAETATILQAADAGSGRSIGLLPLTHIAILRKDAIVPRMTQSMAMLAEAHRNNRASFPSNLVHISGPSNTADIELVRVVGVHGPINVTFILVG